MISAITIADIVSSSIASETVSTEAAAAEAAAAVEPAGNSSSSAVRPPEEVAWSFIVSAFSFAIVMVVMIFAYRCRAYRLRQEELAQEQKQKQELFEHKVANEAEADDVPEWVDPHRGAAHAGLGNDYYMSAYKKLLVDV